MLAYILYIYFTLKSIKANFHCEFMVSGLVKATSPGAESRLFVLMEGGQ